MCSNSWEYIYEKRDNKAPEFEIENYNDRIQLIVYEKLYFKDDIILKIGKYIDKQYDPILLSSYLSYALRQNLKIDSLLPKLIQFYENEKDNSLPCFYLSYYYGLCSDFKLSLKYLHQANQKAYFDNFREMEKKIVFNYVYEKSKDKLFAYGSSLFGSDGDLLIVLRRMSHKLLINQSDALKNEMFFLAQTIEKNCNTLIDRLIITGVQLDCVDENKHPKLHSDLKNKHEYIFDLQCKLEDRNGEKELMNYLAMAYEYGEIYALENLP